MDVLFSSLDSSDTGAIVIDARGDAIFMNDLAMLLLDAPDGSLPRWTDRYVVSLMAGLRATGRATERWEHDGLLLRVQARPVERLGWCAVIEISIARTVTETPIAPQLKCHLHLRRREAQLLEMLWRGMSEDEIIEHTGLHKRRLHSRLTRLYRKLHVDQRPAAVLRAAQALAA